MRWVLWLLVLGVMGCGRNTALVEAVPDETPLPVPTEEPEEQAKRMIKVFYLNPFGEGLVSVEREIFELTDRDNQVKQAIDLLTVAPAPAEGTVVWPSQAYARELFLLDDGTAVVDLDSSFTRSTAAGTGRELWMVYSMVATILTNFEEFDRVQILVDGRVQETLLGQIDIESPLKMDERLLVIDETEGNEEIEVEDLQVETVKEP